MKKSNSFKYTIISGIIVMILGTLLHFVYEWTCDNKCIAAVSAVNESTWEHLKLIFYPMFLTTIIGYFVIGKEYSNFLFARLLGILTAISFTIIFFYTYSGIVGNNFAPIDIGIFFVAVILGEFVSYKVLNSGLKCNKYASLSLLIALLLCFIVFTYKVPRIGLFRDPLNSSYGIEEEK